MDSVFSGAGRQPVAARSRAERVGFGRRFVGAVSFGSVPNPVNSSIIATGPRTRRAPRRHDSIRAGRASRIRYR